MNYYIEMTLRPDADIGLFFLWEKVFHKVHAGLVAFKEPEERVPIGLSFPEYDGEKGWLGTKLRFFASDQKYLENLNIRQCLAAFADYIHLTRIRSVPDHITAYACYKRQQPKSSLERLARRKAKREGISVKEAFKRLDGFEERRVRTPFINMTSQSSRKRFKLFILKEEAHGFQSEGFSCYGLSRHSTVPEF